MLKFVKHHLETITGIEIYPLVSLCVFFAFFVALVYYTVKLSKKYIQSMENLPLDNETE